MITYNTHRPQLSVFTALCLAGSGLAAAWQPVPGKIMTRWAKDVSPDNVLPEYPRPQLVRTQWQNLNGLWDYALTPLDAAQPPAFGGKILVPFCIESALSGVKQPLTAEQRLWYRRSFAAPAAAGGKRLLLHFGAVDWEAKVAVNGKLVGTHKGGYDAFTCDITEAVRPGADNELVVAVFDSTCGAQARGKQKFDAIAHTKGIRYTPCSGIWQTVWMETVPSVYIESLKIVPDVDGGSVAVTVNTKGGGKAKLSAIDGDKVIASAEGDAGQPVVVKIPDAKLWSPEQPFLYDLRVECGEDSVKSYFGMRKLSMGKDDKGVTRMLFNGKPVFQVGFLDQGYWPDGIYTAPTDEALRYDIEMTKRLGMRVARKHVKVEPDRWYYWCDKLGLLVWQDMPSAGPVLGAVGSGAGKQKDGTMADGKANSPEGAAQFEAELKAMVEGRGNHPSIVMWIVFNEGWGQYDTPRLTNWVKQLDPSRWVNNASGGHDIAAGDVMDGHLYPGPCAPKPTDGRASVCGECGGITLPTSGHTWDPNSWGYRKVANPEILTSTFVGLITRAYALRDSDGLDALIYTQTTDVETECNGAITYDREVTKLDIPQAAAATQGKVPPAQ